MRAEVHQLLHLTDIKRPTDFVGDQEHAETPLKCFFHFEIPQYLKCELLGQNTGLLCDLPASFPCGVRPPKATVLQERCEGDCHISYKIQVHAICRRKVIASSSQQIKIVPTFESRPPVCVADFPNEYTLAKSTRLRTGFLGLHHTGEWRLEAGGPVQLVLNQLTDPVLLSTTLTLTQTIYSSQSCPKWKPWDLASGNCTCNLISSTFISCIPRSSVPTLQELATSTCLSRQNQVCAEKRTAVQFSKWNESTLTLHGEDFSSEVTRQWTSNASVTITIPNEKYLVPTFESSLVSRRYKLVLHVHITKPHRSAFRLTLPVQISYQKNTAHRPWSAQELESPPYI